MKADVTAVSPKIPDSGAVALATYPQVIPINFIKHVLASFFMNLVIMNHYANSQRIRIIIPLILKKKLDFLINIAIVIAFNNFSNNTF